MEISNIEAVDLEDVQYPRKWRLDHLYFGKGDLVMLKESDLQIPAVVHEAWIHEFKIKYSLRRIGTDDLFHVKGAKFKVRWFTHDELKPFLWYIRNVPRSIDECVCYEYTSMSHPIPVRVLFDPVGKHEETGPTSREFFRICTDMDYRRRRMNEHPWGAAGIDVQKEMIWRDHDPVAIYHKDEHGKISPVSFGRKHVFLKDDPRKADGICCGDRVSIRSGILAGLSGEVVMMGKDGSVIVDIGEINYHKFSIGELIPVEKVKQQQVIELEIELN